MPISSSHPDHDKRAGQWKRCRDIFKGVDAVKGRMEKMGRAIARSIDTSSYIVRGRDLVDNTAHAYLPPLSKNHTGYASYLARAYLYPAVRRTITSLVGAVYRRNPEIEGVDALGEWVNHVDGINMTLEGAARRILMEVLVSGRCPVSVMYSPTGGLKWRIYDAEDLINWKEDGDKAQWVVFRESINVTSEDDPFLSVPTDFYRYVGQEGGVTTRLYNEAGEVVSEGEEGDSVGRSLSFLPIVVVNASREGLKTERPPLLDLVDVNLSHYMGSADREHALHWSALPTPWVSGVSAEEAKKVQIGGTALITLPEMGKAGMLEVSGAGYTAMKEALDEKVQHMASLGARLIAPEHRQAETAEAVRIKSGGDANNLYSILVEVEKAMVSLLKLTGDRFGVSVDPTFTFNRDLYDARLSSEDVDKLIKLRSTRNLSGKTLHTALRDGEWVGANNSYEEELALIKAEQILAEPEPEGPDAEANTDD